MVPLASPHIVHTPEITHETLDVLYVWIYMSQRARGILGSILFLVQTTVTSADAIMMVADAFVPNIGAWSSAATVLTIQKYR